jgi:serine-type D-Ala-D-Ala carboxypeptidase/endopeptidase (penicillin-binding protein 4)
VLAAVLAGSLVAGGATVVLQDRSSPADTPATAPAAEPPGAAPSPTVPVQRAPLLLPAGGPAPPAPTGEGLREAVLAALDDPAVAGRLAVSVVDAETGAPLLELAARELRLPASKTKIATAVAVLTAVDPQSRLTTRLVAGASPGEVVLVGGGDTTLASPQAAQGYPRPARLADLATAAQAVLGPEPLQRLLVDDSRYVGPRTGPGWRPGYVTGGNVAPVGALMVDGGRVRPDRNARAGDPALAAGQALADLLQRPGAPRITVERGEAAPGALELARVSSPTLAQLVEVMLSRSDNDLAESLARQTALATGRTADFAGGAAAVRDVLGARLEEVGVGGDAVQVVDGSGLSRDNRIQPAALTRLLAAVASGDEPRLAPVLTGLPVGGFDGTLSDRYRADAARAGAGVVRAKTGTLSDVSALAGLVRTREGRLLAFDLTADGVPPGSGRAAEAALDRLAAVLASCGCR